MKPPVVSVILPNYNHARFLTQRIESILYQSYQDFELIILDDCSSDNSREVINQYRNHPKVSQIVFNEKNSGSPFRQWNKGVQLAQGKYIWIAESDDYCTKDLLATLVALLDADAGTGIAYCRSAFVDEDGNFLYDSTDRTASIAPERWLYDFKANGKEEIAQYLYRLNTIPNASAVVFRKSYFMEAGCAPTYMRMCGDWFLWCKMLALCDVAYSAVSMNFFRIHAQTTRIINNSEKQIRRTKEELILNQLFRQYIGNSFLDNERHRLIHYWIDLHHRYQPFQLLTARPAGWTWMAYWREIVGYYKYFRRSK
jgi:glycosyltransferase involved in cell wall biosynthesis